jgi:hypothetical protein
LRKQHSKTSRCNGHPKRSCVETEQRNVLLLKQLKIFMGFPSQKSCRIAVPMLRMTVTTRKIVMLLKQHMISDCCNSFFCVSFSSALARAATLAAWLPSGPTFGCSSSKAPSLFGCVLWSNNFANPETPLLSAGALRAGGAAETWDAKGLACPTWDLRSAQQCLEEKQHQKT